MYEKESIPNLILKNITHYCFYRQTDMLRQGGTGTVWQIRTKKKQSVKENKNEKRKEMKQEKGEGEGKEKQFKIKTRRG